MSLLPIIIAPDATLKQKSTKIDVVDDFVRTTLDDMAETMYDMEGIGLAAVQVGILKKLIVVDVNWRDKEIASRKPLKLINAEIINNSDEQNTYKEGCLSFPDQFSEVVRPKQIKISYMDEQGKQQELTADGLLATCIQHEIDHTNGITFVDHISRTKRDMILTKLTKAKKRGDFEPHIHGEHCQH
jgi:peptide deformylase